MKFRDPIQWEASLQIRPSSPAWRATIKAAYGSKLSDDERSLFLTLSGGVEPPQGGAHELTVIAGRRGGKSEAIARLAMFEALFANHDRSLARGQVGVIHVISPLREQSAEILNYCRGLALLPQVRRFVANVTKDGIEFNHRITIQISTADVLNLSGPTAVCAILDEAAKLPGKEAKVPDTELLATLRPALAPMKGAPRRRLIKITSAYLSDGIAYDDEKNHFGKKDAPILVVRGSTEQFNPNVDREWLAREQKLDPRAFAREYLCEWQDAICESWLGHDVVARSIDRGRTLPLPYEKGRTYFCAIDAAWKHDLFAFAVVTSERGRRNPETSEDNPRKNIVVGVYVLQPKPGSALSPEECVREVATVCRRYQTNKVHIDQYCAQPLIESFYRRGIKAIEMPWTAATKPARFRAVRESMADGLFRLPDDPALVREFMNLRSELLRSGGERIEAARGTDDRACAVVLAASAAMAAPASIALKDLSLFERREKALNGRRVGAALWTTGFDANGYARLDDDEDAYDLGMTPAEVQQIVDQMEENRNAHRRRT